MSATKENIKTLPLMVNPEKCIGCVSCLKTCPTQAIRLVNGLPVKKESYCIDCGECMRTCRLDAFTAESDGFDKIKQYKYKVALFPSVFIGQFPERISEDQIYSSLLEIGFTHAYEVEQNIDILKEVIQSNIDNEEKSKPIISSFCPSIVRLIRSKYPSFTGNLSQTKTPQDLTAMWVLNKFEQKGIKREDIGLFYITPCISKIASIKQPINESFSKFEGVINMQTLYNKVMTIAEDVKIVDTSSMRVTISKESVLWSLRGGEASLMKGRIMAVDGVHNVIKIMERLENEEFPDIDFLELRSCDQGCAGGVLLAQNRFLTAERLANRSKRYPSYERTKWKRDHELRERLKEDLIAQTIAPRAAQPFSSDMVKALKQMQRSRSIMCILPGIDCGACGAPTCLALSQDISTAKAKMSDCIFLQQVWQTQGKIKADKASRNMEKKWGEHRFDPDCTKKGAKNESF